MPYRLTNPDELVIATITVLSTMITGQFLLDFILGIITYTSARLFYYYFGNDVKRLCDRLKEIGEKYRRK